ncbi:MAG: hypothetical protein ACPGNT_06100 [Rhodospirillales bacterium]
MKTDPDRRSLIRTRPNPEDRRDYVVALNNIRIGQLELRVLYVPDKLILDVDSLVDWVDALAATSWPDPETAAAAVRDDISNELVPKWQQIVLTRASHSRGGSLLPGHQVILEDRQPRWDNRNLLDRLNFL